MPIFKPIQESESKGKVKEIYDEIKTTRQITEVPNFWQMLANDPNELDRTWNSLKELSPDELVKATQKLKKDSKAMDLPVEQVIPSSGEIISGQTAAFDEYMKKIESDS